LHKRKYVHKKHITHLLFVSSLLILSTFFNPSYSFSQDYRMGYVSCIINEVLPEEKLDFYIRDQELTINLFERELEPSTKEKLLQRLKKTNFFENIQITIVTPESVSVAPQGTSFVKSHASHPTLEVLPEGVIYDTPIADPK
jgi:hypothetical protein